MSKTYASASADASDLCSAVLTANDMDDMDTVYVYHKSRIIDLYRKWSQLLPDVTPFYAIKCNPDPLILDTLSSCGASFDAASPAEVDAALERVPPSRVIYANPCKTKQDITYAVDKGVSLTVFDNPFEYDKIVRSTSDVRRPKMLLRIYANDISAKCVLSNKFGAFPDEVASVLEHIADMNQQDNVVGVSFHIGSGANDPLAFERAIQATSDVFHLASTMGFKFSILDIGGGFTSANITDMASCINKSVAVFKTKYSGVKVIAEPGRYFAETVADLYTKIIGVRVRKSTGHRSYWINDSIYGSFNCMMYDHASPVPQSLALHTHPRVTSTIWGATCDGMDKVAENIDLPILSEGDWLLWNNMGAYTQAGASHFNGIPFANIKKIYL